MKKLSGKIKLKHLLTSVVALAFLLSNISSLYSSYQGSIKLLEEQSLQKNEVYAMKVSQMVNYYLSDSLHILQHSAEKLSTVVDQEPQYSMEVTHLLEKENIFNSVIIANKEGTILAGAPAIYDLKGKQVTSKEGLKLIEDQKPAITNSYKASTGRVMITLSYPIFSDKGEYEGLINGTIYLHQSNFFDTILGRNEYQDGSYVDMVDSNGKIIFHKNQERIGDDVSSNEVIQRVMKGDNGSQHITNTLGNRMLAGFSAVNISNWGIVVQTPHEIAVNSAKNQVIKMFFAELPLLIFSVIIIFIMIGNIVRPLQKIAVIVENSTQENEVEKLSQLRVWYYEALQIKNALIQSFSFLHDQVIFLKHQSNIDPLTQLTNRRALDTVLQSLIKLEKDFTIILIDIDYFKSFNDTYGHHIGDEVLKMFSRKLKEAMWEKSICCRYGGEEFMVIIPEANAQQANTLSEDFRKLLKTVESPSHRPITFSAGIAEFSHQMTSLEEVIKLADDALYEAKKRGRDCIVISSRS